MSNNRCSIKLRRGTAAEWTAANELLALGEPGYEKDTGKLKIGDGTTPWNSLDYFNDGTPINPEELQDLIGGSEFLVAGSGINISYNDGADSLTISTSGVSFNGHTHSSSDITDFNISVSGLIPVKDIVAGSGIGVTSTSGIYTINSSNTVAADTLEPDGFVNRTNSTISFNDGSRQFSIAPKSPATSYAIYNNGVKVIKNSTEIITLPDTTALYFIHFDKSTNNLSYKTTGFDFDTDIPIAQIYYNADDNKAVYFGEERHGIRMDASTHRYLHNVFGTQYVNGLSISNYSTSGNGSSNSDATIAIGDGLIYDEDIEANITHSNTPNDPFEQILNPIAVIPVYYKVGSNGSWTDTTANNYPIKTGTTIQYNLNSAGTWSASNSDNPTNNRYIAYWICATTQENAPIISIMGQRVDSSLEQATSNNSWDSLNLTGLPIVELRPLYRLIYDTKSTFSNTPKGFLADVLDIRSHIDTVTGLTQNDHGSLYGLADDDHYQYVHIDNARTIDAIHTFSGGLNAGGLISAASGNFTSLTVNSTGVSLVGHTHASSNITDFSEAVQDVIGANGFLIPGTGINISYNDGVNTLTISTTGLQPSGNYSTIGHTHTASNITDFNSSVSGLLPTIANSGDNRLLTSIGTSTGINAEEFFTFDSSTKELRITSDSTDPATGPWIIYTSYGDELGSKGARLVGRRYRGSVSSPLSANDNDTMLILRADSLNSVGQNRPSARIIMAADGVVGSDAVPGRIEIATSSGPAQTDNILVMYSSGQLNYNGYVTIEDGLSAPTPIYNLGTISGNTAINYGPQIQIQELTLNGTSVNFTKGTGWNTSGRAYDVLLKIIVTSTTTVAFDSLFITDWFNTLPTFTSGTYLILIRNFGASNIHGHYIGKKV